MSTERGTGLRPVDFGDAKAIADAVLLEGYLLYPYRASAQKNQLRWQFGVLNPRECAEKGSSEPWMAQTECLCEQCDRAVLRVMVRFLQVQARTVEEAAGFERFRPVPSLDYDGVTLICWDEGIPREVDVAVPLVGEQADGCYVNTAGVGVLERPVTLSAANARPGDAVIVSGPIGDHGVTIMLARGELDIESDITSDTAPLNGLVDCLLDATTGVRCLRDATRGGVATILNEVAVASGVAIVLEEAAVPTRPEVRGASEILGIDPLYVASEGRLVAVVDGAEADAALGALHSHPLGKQAAAIGTVKADPPTLVLLKTEFGGTRIVDMLIGDPLPRIC